jgi:methylmalonyl-CoA mutase
MRMAEPFEALRDAADAHAEKTGAAPRRSSPRWARWRTFNARASFASNRLAVAGVERRAARIRRH